jgi:hypothetical protein
VFGIPNLILGVPKAKSGVLGAVLRSSNFVPRFPDVILGVPRIPSRFPDTEFGVRRIMLGVPRIIFGSRKIILGSQKHGKPNRNR